MDIMISFRRNWRLTIEIVTFSILIKDSKIQSARIIISTNSSTKWIVNRLRIPILQIINREIYDWHVWKKNYKCQFQNQRIFWLTHIFVKLENWNILGILKKKHNYY